MANSIINYDDINEFEDISADANFSALGMSVTPYAYPSEVFYHTFRRAAYYRPERSDSSYGPDTATVTASPPTIRPLTSTPFVDGDITIATENINVASHPLVAGDAILLTGAALPEGLAFQTYYFVYVVDADNVMLMPTYADAIAGTNPVDITAANTGATYYIWYHGSMEMTVFNNYIVYNDLDLRPIANSGTIRWTWVPTEDGNPSGAYRGMWTILTKSGPGRTTCLFYPVGTTGFRMNVLIYDDAGALHSISTSGVAGSEIVPVEGTPIHFEFCWNNATGEHDLWVDGVNEASSIIPTYTRTQAESLRIGTYTSGYFAKGLISDFRVFSTPQRAHGVDFSSEMPIQPTPSYPLDISARWIYEESTTELISFVATYYKEVNAGNDIRFVFYNSYYSMYFWYNFTTAAVEPSNGHWDQANTVAEMGTIPSTAFAQGFVGKIVTLLRSNYWDSPVLQRINIEYTFWTPPRAAFTCVVFGYVVDGSGNPVAGAEIKAMSDDFFDGLNRVTKDISTTTSSLGYWEMAVVETETIDKKVTFLIKYSEDSGQVKTTEVSGMVPKLSSCSIDHVVAGTCYSS